MALQLKISLDHSKPPIWRRILIPHHFTFAKLHLTIQVAMGWENSHLYAFWQGNDSRNTIGMLFDPDWDAVIARDSSKIMVAEELSREKQKMKYEYDFGDSWVHTIILEKITDDRILGPKCLKGKMACPPEDCGGIRGYYDLLDKINDPDSPEYEEYREWLGLENDQVWLEEAFDLESCNQRVLHFKDYEVSWDED